MSTWFSRASNRLADLLDPAVGPWRPRCTDWTEVDADVRRLRQEFHALSAHSAECR